MNGMRCCPAIRNTSATPDTSIIRRQSHTTLSPIPTSASSSDRCRIPMFTAQLKGHDLHDPDRTTIDGVRTSVRERVPDDRAALQLSATPCPGTIRRWCDNIELGTRIADTAILQADGTVSWLTANRSTMAGPWMNGTNRGRRGLYDGGTGMFRRTVDTR